MCARHFDLLSILKDCSLSNSRVYTCDGGHSPKRIRNFEWLRQDFAFGGAVARQPRSPRLIEGLIFTNITAYSGTSLRIQLDV